MGKKRAYYAVKIGDTPGVYNSWEDCQRNTAGYSNATFKKFESKELAQDFMSMRVNDGESSSDIYRRYNSGGSSATSNSSSYSGNHRSTLQPAASRSSYSNSGPLRSSGFGGSSGASNSSYSSSSSSNYGSTVQPAASRSCYSNSGPLVSSGYGGTSYGGYSSPSSSSSSLGDRSTLKAVTTKSIYTDGAARGNGKVGAVAGYGVYYGPNDNRNVGLPVEGSMQTNQRAELLALDHALTSIHKELETSSASDHKYKIYTDSQYGMNCFTKWAPSWKEKNWRIEDRGPDAFKSSSSSAPKPAGKTFKDVSHKDIIQPGYEVLQKINSKYKDMGYGPLEIEYVKAHNGDPGNELADRLANLGADKNPLSK